MKSIWIFLIFVLACSMGMAVYASSNLKEPASQLSIYEGKWYPGQQDLSYKEYDLALRNRMAIRINKRFGIKLDTQTYSGFDLLEIEALLRLKKSNESFDLFLKIFPKSP